MASNEPNREEQEDEQFYQAFGEHTGISSYIRKAIQKIKNNDVDTNKFTLASLTTAKFTRLAWQLLGRYIANNTHLTHLDIDGCHLTNINVSTLFRELVSGVPLKMMDLNYNSNGINHNIFGIDGLRHMVPLLQNSPILSKIYFSRNINFNSECFQVLVSALNGKPVEKLYFERCSINDISALITYTLPNLTHLQLDKNNIGREGCTILSNLLQKDDTKLETLQLNNTGIDDEGAEILASSLKHNTNLYSLELEDNNNITKIGRRAFLKLLINISSIESTYNSNNTLYELNLDNSMDGSFIQSALEMNGKAKVIRYQLNSQKRKKLCRLQGVEYSAEDNMLADIEPTIANYPCADR